MLGIETWTLSSVWVSDRTKEHMPMWCPPTPPQNDNDVYMDQSLGFLYEQTIMSESQLPPVYIKKELKRRLDLLPMSDREGHMPHLSRPIYATAGGREHELSPKNGRSHPLRLSSNGSPPIQVLMTRHPNLCSPKNGRSHPLRLDVD
uniref:Uncharacterized protein n=1 Tax=Timema bartmani TaxID=61472 RepID=A0A7R9ESG6_9NEOP|nr:unnamed protein product [Timema bartmani]